MQVTTRNLAPLMLTAMLVTACATPPPAPETAQAPAATEPLPVSYTPAQVRTLMDILSKHRRTLFSVTSGEYSYFIGGVLSAVYNPAKGHFTVTPENTDADKSCVYDAEGRLRLEGYAGTSGELHRATCDALLSTLEDSLAIP